jgi:hypothetical protein
MIKYLTAREAATRLQLDQAAFELLLAAGEIKPDAQVGELPLFLPQTIDQHGHLTEPIEQVMAKKPANPYYTPAKRCEVEGCHGMAWSGNGIVCRKHLPKPERQPRTGRGQQGHKLNLQMEAAGLIPTMKAAQYLGISRSSLQTAFEHGKIVPDQTVGRFKYFLPATLDAYQDQYGPFRIKGSGRTTCSIDGCGKRISDRESGYCQAHALRFHKYGDPEFNKRQPNPIEIYADHAEMTLRGRNGEDRGRVSFSLDKVDLVKGYSWRRHPGGTVRSNKAGGLHILLAGTVGANEYVAFKDGNPDNLRNENLEIRLMGHWMLGFKHKPRSRAASPIIIQTKIRKRRSDYQKKDPQDHKPSGRPNKYGCAGVFYKAREHCYQARIIVDGQRHYLGSFKTVEEAIAARKAAEVMYLGGIH